LSSKKTKKTNTSKVKSSTKKTVRSGKKKKVAKKTKAAAKKKVIAKTVKNSKFKSPKNILSKKFNSKSSGKVKPGALPSVRKSTGPGNKKPPLTPEQINDLLPPESASQDRIEEAMNLLDRKNLDLPSHGYGQDDANIPAPKPTVGKKSSSDNASGGIEEYGRSRMDDPVRMYLRQMGQIPLLRRQEEIAIAKKIEDCETDVQKAVYETKAARFEVLELARKIIADEVNLEALIETDQESTLMSIKRKLKKLIGRLRASRKGSIATGSSS